MLAAICCMLNMILSIHNACKCTYTLAEVSCSLFACLTQSCFPIQFESFTMYLIHTADNYIVPVKLKIPRTDNVCFQLTDTTISVCGTACNDNNV